jgi:hypothetical protein
MTTDPIPTSSSINDLRPHLARIESALAAIRRRARLLLILKSAAWIIAAIFAALFVGAALDYVLRAPSTLRTAGLLIAIVLLIVAIIRLVLPAARFNPSLTEVALRVERSDQPAAAHLGGVLASGLELGQESIASLTPQQRALALPVIARAADAAPSIRLGPIFRPAGAIAAAVACTLAIFAALSFSAAQPSLTRIGLSRMLAPWSSAEWPKRTGVADATNITYHPLGTALSLRAALTKSDAGPDKTSVAATYRVTVNNQRSAEKRLLLTNQGRSITTTDRDDQPATGILFERLLEPSAFAIDPKSGATSATLEYRLSTDDDETPTRTITLVEPPAVVSAVAKITPPVYAAAFTDTPSSPLDLGPGSDERSSPAPILAGSAVALTFTFNKPLSAPAIADAANITRTFGPDFASLYADTAAPAVLMPSADSRTWTLTWTHLRSVRLALHPVDEFNIGAPEEAVFRFDVLNDNPPTATVITPSEDKSVLPTAIVDLAAEARDDIALTSVSLDRQIARRVKGSESRAVEASDEPTSITTTTAETGPGIAASKRLVASSSLDLSTLGVQPGDEVWITALATDAFALQGKTHTPVRSQIRKLRIMSRDELVEQLWSELSGVRKSAIRLDQEQQEASKLSRTPGEDSARRAERAQAGITERLARQRETLKRLEQRASENALSDATVNQVLRQAADTLDRAGKQSAEAAKSMSSAAQAEAQEAPDTKASQEAREKASEDQQSVRDELAQLVDLLDQGEDTFASKRSLERMLEQQKALQERTKQTGQKTTGKSDDQIAPADRQSLDDISKEQQALAEQLKDAVRKMQEREQKLSKSDPAAAQAMAQAARKAEREQVAEKMEQAAQQAQQNQTNNAQQQQQQAAQAMEDMLKELDKANANRDEVLRRQLASLIESIQGLIQQQTLELAELVKRQATNDFQGLDTSMARLHTNTLGVLEEANNAPREVAGIIAPLTRAADAQAKSVSGLRAAPVVEDEVQKLEDESLEKLNEALRLAKSIDREAAGRENDRKRAELKGKYEEALKTQLSIKDSVEGLSTQPNNRRTQAAARLAGQEQTALRDSLTQLRASTSELSDAKVFDFAHDRVDKLMDDAAKSLGDGTADDSVLRRQTSAARVLRSMVDALNDKKDKPDPFRKNESSGNGAGSGAGQKPPMLPPAAEIRLLRAMQQEAADLTRSAADTKSPDAANTLTEAAALQRDLAKQAADLLKRAAEEGDSKQPKPSMPKITPVKPDAVPNEQPEPKPETDPEESKP